MGAVETARQRRLARAILGLVAGSVALFVLFASGPKIGLTFAQQTTPTFRIAFLNPSSHSEEISEKNDGTNDTYHLVAWVNAVPENAAVVFAYDDADGNEIEIGTATQTGVPDTFDLQWDIPADLADQPAGPAPADTPFTLHAILYSGQTEVARDTESDLFLNNKSPGPMSGDPEPENQGETVEMTYPAVGGAFGFYTPRDEGAVGIVDVTRSANAVTVRVFFTATAPGNEPAWTQCGSESVANAANGVRCTLPAGRDPATVTALGALAIDSPAPTQSNNDSGDAHRISPYTQVPTNLTVDPASQSVGATEECSGVITSTLVDQNGINIGGANIDVHAAGPTDQLFFGDDAQRPEQGHGNEPAVDCADSPPSSSGEQGDHENTTGNDTKHVESPSGTDDDGKWPFQLYSPTSGETHFTAWVDHDADDLYCSNETNASGAIGWQQSAPGIVGVNPDTSTCPSPAATTSRPGPTTPGPTPTDGQPDPRDCTVTGTDGSEKLEGTPDDDVICSYEGDDILIGLGGNDILYGDGGSDDVRGGDGNDVMYGDVGQDKFRGGAGSDQIFGDADQDVVAGDSGNDVIEGGGGPDTLRGNSGNDRIFGRARADNLIGGVGSDRLSGGEGNDTLRGGKGRDRCSGGSGSNQFKSCERGDP